MTELIGWDLDGGSNSKKNTFTKFPEGITRIRILDERPHVRWAHWLPQYNRKISCPGFGCPIDNLIKKAKEVKTTSPYNSTRAIALNIYNYDSGQREILEEGVTMFDELKVAIQDAMRENPGKGIRDFIFKVRKRKGADGKAKWNVTLDSVTALSEVELTAIKEAVNLEEMFKAPTIEQIDELLSVQAVSKEEYLENYNTILGYTKNESQQDEGLGIETE